MNIDLHQTVRELALNLPSATRVLEKLGIDYCCGGGKSLEQACEESNLNIPQVIDLLESAAEAVDERQDAPHENWMTAPLSDLIAYIVSTHHKYTREEIARLTPLLDKVSNVHGQRHPELLNLRHDFHSLAQELTMHMLKEERVLFPFIGRMEEALVGGDPVLPAPFGTVNNPVQAMIHEHNAAGNLLRSMRTLSDGFEPPAGACTSFKTLYEALDEFERDLHQHIHLENNVLFPRAIAMEPAR